MAFALEPIDDVRDYAVDGGISVMSIAPGTTYTVGVTSTWSGSYSYGTSSGGTSSNSISISGSKALTATNNYFTLYNSGYYAFGIKSSYITVPSNAKVTVSASCSYPAGNYSLGGGLTSRLALGGGQTNSNARYPTSVTISMGSQVIGTYTMSNGVVQGLPTQIELTSAVSSVTYSFAYSSGTYSGKSSGGNVYLYVYFDDGIVLTEIKEDPYIPILTNILNSFSGIYGLVAGFASSASQAWSDIISAIGGVSGGMAATPQQSAAASQYVKDMEEVQDKIDEANQVIEDNTNRPSADALVPATPDIIQNGVIGGGDAAATAMVDGFGDFLASPLILNALVLVFTLSFLSYVLFGKKG